MHEDGIGMARTFEAEFLGRRDGVVRPEAGFFAWVDGAPAEGYRAPRTIVNADHPHKPVLAAGSAAWAADPAARTNGVGGAPVALRPRRPGPDAPVGVLTGTYGARVLAPLLAHLDRDDLRIVEVDNRFFGGNIGVAGLLVGEDVARILAEQPDGHRYLLPDVCLSQGRFLDGLTVADLPRPVEVVATDGASLRAALELSVPATGAPAPAHAPA
jgi:hypothetical protein